VGLTGVTVKGSGKLLNSRVRDPATGVIRPISGDQRFGTNWEVTYDIPEDGLRFGLNTHDHDREPEVDYRIDQISGEYHQLKVGGFVEYKPSPAWTVRFYGNDLSPSSYFRTREIYNGLRGTVPLSQIERRRLTNGALLGLRIQHEFL
jgi:hypothetical protein